MSQTIPQSPCELKGGKLAPVEHSSTGQLSAGGPLKDALEFRQAYVVGVDGFENVYALSSAGGELLAPRFYCAQTGGDVIDGCVDLQPDVLRYGVAIGQIEPADRLLGQNVDGQQDCRPELVLMAGPRARAGKGGRGWLGGC